MIGHSWQFAVDETVGQTKTIQDNKVDIFRFFFTVFEGLIGDEAVWYGTKAFYQVVQQFIYCAK